MASTLDIAKVRAKFPSLAKADAAADADSAYIFAENAGGSQVLQSVADRISSYLLDTNVQMANYPLAHSAESRVSLGTSAAAVLVGASSVDDVLIGQSATQLTFSLSLMIEHKVLADRKAGESNTWKEGDEIIVSDADHETNRGAWTRLAERLGMQVKHWPVTAVKGPGGSSDNPFAVTLDPAVLGTLLTEKTRLVAFTACSNLLGAFTDISGASKLVRQAAPEALICVDCVAFAPHRKLNPTKWDVDFAFFSLYKTYGAHVGAAYVNPAIRKGRLQRLNHFFLSGKPGMYPYQSSSVQYELNYSISAVGDYLVSLGQGKDVEVDWNHVMGRTDTTAGKEKAQLSRQEVDSALDTAFNEIAKHEEKLMEIFVGYLKSKAGMGVRIVGPESTESSVRAPTVSFTVVDGQSNKPIDGICAQIHKKLVERGKMGAQQGHMYAHKLVSSLGMDLDDGVVRLSFVHYNTEEEVRRAVAILDTVLAQL